MTRENLLDVAFRYKKSALWKKLWDNEIFAIKLKSGEIGYISIMGKNGEYCALGLYIGEDAFQTYRILVDIDKYTGSEFKDHERLLQQKCLQAALETKDELMTEEIEEVRAYAKGHGIRLSGKNAYPQFIKYEPNFYPWKLKTNEEIDALYEALEAATLLADVLRSVKPFEIGIIGIGPETDRVPLFEVKGNNLIQSGFAPLPGDREETYEYVPAVNEIAMAAMKRLPRGGIWEAELVRLLEPVQDSPEETPYFPMLLILAENESSYMISVPMELSAEQNPQEMLEEVAEAWKKHDIYPEEIRCRDERTYAVLKDFSEKTDVTICIYEGEMFALDEAEESLCEYFYGTDDDEMLYQIMETVETILAMSPSELYSIPKPLIEQVKLLIEYDDFPRDVAAKLRRKLKNL
jgi:hypothetical protein